MDSQATPPANKPTDSQSENSGKPAQKDRTLPPDITSFKELVKHASTRPNLSTQFKQEDKNTFSMGSQSNSDSYTDEGRETDAKSSSTETTRKEDGTGSKKETNFLPDVTEFDAALKAATFIPVHHFQDIPVVLKEIIGKHASQGTENQIESYLFRTQLGKESKLDILLKRDDSDKMVIRLYADGELSDLLQNNRESLLAHLRKKGIDVSEVIIESPPEKHSGGQSQHSSSDSQGQNSEDTDGANKDEFVL